MIDTKKLAELADDLEAFTEERLNVEPWTCEQIAKKAARTVREYAELADANRRRAEAAEARASETAISARASDDGWREISSAPKDGTKFLVWDEHYGVRIGRAHMRADHDDWLSYMHGFGNSSKGGLRASHWHPLPAPPAIRAQDE